MDLHHPILREFPEHRETIKHLKGADERFRKMFEEYHSVDDAIYRIGEDIAFATDQQIGAVKFRRAWRKNQIYSPIPRAPTVAPAPGRASVPSPAPPP